MRGARWLLVLAILAILAGISAIYRYQKADQAKHALAKPAALPSTLSGKLEDWQWSQKNQGHPIVQIRARDVKQEKDSNKTQLERVELRLYNKEGNQFDLVRSARAELDQSTDRLFSEGQVDITLHLPVEGEPERTPVTIRSSGVTFETKSGKASTSQPTHFNFENGEGDSLGATYDPATRELHLLNQVQMKWKAASPGAKAMRLETGDLNYKEGSSLIWLNPWAKLYRDNAVMEAGPTLVTMQNQVIHQVDAQKAHGVDEYPHRSLQYAADELRVTYTDEGQIDHVAGKNNARLVSASEGSQTTMTTDRVDLDFEVANGESVLKKVVGDGHTIVESKPIVVPGVIPPETRVLTSQTVEIRMRPGGREMERVLTRTPGHLDFLPNHASQRKRSLDGADMDIGYGPQNQIQSFRCVNARTRTEPTAEEAAKKHVASTTRSKNLKAEFDPKTGQMSRMEQWEDFAYEEGDRKTQAHRAVLEHDSNVIVLETKARVWDASASTNADRIRLDQKTGDFAADGHVTSSRLPDKKGSSSEMLSGDEPIQALADHMTAANHNRLIHYEGHAVMWQGSDRLQAEKIDLDREKRVLKAHGGVFSQLLEKPAAPTEPATGSEARPTATPPQIFTIVKADDLVYTEEDRLAHYSGKVALTRPNLSVKAGDLRAFLSDTKSKPADEQDSRLEKAFADRNVEIVQTAPDRTRTGTSEHAEYYTDTERILLRGGEPLFADSLKGNTKGTELTYFVNDDRLLVSGAPGSRSTSRLRRK